MWLSSLVKYTWYAITTLSYIVYEIALEAIYKSLDN